jgi:hypothetical protein
VKNRKIAAWSFIVLAAAGLAVLVRQQKSAIRKIERCPELTSVDIGDILPGKTAEIKPGSDFDIDGYGRMFGLHFGSDEGRFVYTRVAGDFEVTVQVAGIHNADQAYTEAGLMVRGNLNPTSLMAGQFVTNNEYRYGDADQYTFIYRLREGGSLEEGQIAGFFGPGTHGNAGFGYSAHGYLLDNLSRSRPFPNVRLRLRKTGNTFTGYIRENSDSWIQVGSTNLNLGESPFVGMCITANHHGPKMPTGNAETAGMVSFRNFTIIRKGR